VWVAFSKLTHRPIRGSLPTWYGEWKASLKLPYKSGLERHMLESTLRQCVMVQSTAAVSRSLVGTRSGTDLGRLVSPCSRGKFSIFYSYPDCHGCMARGGHGLPWVSLGLALPNPLRPAGRPSLKRRYGHFRGGLPTGRAACGRVLPFWTPHAICLCSYPDFTFPAHYFFFLSMECLSFQLGKNGKIVCSPFPRVRRNNSIWIWCNSSRLTVSVLTFQLIEVSDFFLVSN
jgi:hypothetical protein